MEWAWSEQVRRRFGPRLGSVKPSSGCWIGTSQRPLLSISSGQACEPTWRGFHEGRFKLMVPTGKDRKPDRDKDNSEQRFSDLDGPRKFPLHCECCLP